MISPNYTIPTPTVSTLTSTYAQLKKTVKVIKMSRDFTPRSMYDKPKRTPRSPCASNVVQFQLLFTKLRHFEENGTPHLSLICGHRESVSRTEPVFELNLAPSCKLQQLCQGKGQRSHRAKNRRKHFRGKIEIFQIW